MPSGFRARILLAVSVPTVLALLLARAGVATWLGAAVTAMLCGWLLASAFERRTGAQQAAAAQSLHQAEQKVDELTIDWARTEAILSGMVEGVLVVDSSGRLRLINDAARRMLNLEDTALTRHYLESVRHPSIVQQLGAGLRGERPEAIEVPIDGRIFSTQATPAKIGRASCR